MQLLYSILLLSLVDSETIDRIKWLQSFNYLPKGSNQMSGDRVKEAIKDMQYMAGLEETGEFDERTIGMMNRQRCGHPDRVDRRKDGEGGGRMRRYADYGKWDKKTITYTCTGSSSRISTADLRRAMHQAATQWSELADIEIVETSSDKPMILATVGNHYKCPYPFESRVLAHAFAPPHGQIHVNDMIQFAMTNYTRPNLPNSLYSVVAHEMGHALGFEHSPEVDSLMYAYDIPREWKFTRNDRYIVERKYGTKKGKKKEKKEEKEGEKDRRKEEKDDIRPDECRVDNPVVVYYRGEFLVFKSSWVWRVSSDWRRLIVKPMPIEQMFVGLPSPIDAAVVVNGDLWVFIGDKIYVINGTRIKHTPFTLPYIGINETSVDLAYEWHYFNPPAIYIWKGHKYWKLDEKYDYQRIDERYPKNIDLNWARVPKGVHSAFNYDKEIHFIRGDLVYRMNSSKAVFDISDHFPQPLRSMFQFCPHAEHLVSSNAHYLFYIPIIISFIVFS